MAGAAFQSANSRAASRAEIGARSSFEAASSLDMAESSSMAVEYRSPTAEKRRSRSRRGSGSRSLALNAFLLAVHGLLHARGRARIFPADFTQRRAGGFLLLQRRQRLSQTQQRVRSFRRGVELGGHGEKRLRRVAVQLALKEAFAQPVL